MPHYLKMSVGIYLSNHRINVTLPGSKPRVLVVKCGVPQGSVKGPNLWNVGWSTAYSSSFGYGNRCLRQRHYIYHVGAGSLLSVRKAEDRLYGSH